MITQLLNRDFLLDCADELLEALDGGFVERSLAPDPARRGGGMRDAGPAVEEFEGEAPLSDVDLDAAQALLREAAQVERADSSGQRGFPAPPPERRGGQPASLDDLSFLSRDPVLSNLQSALELHLEEELEAELPDDDRRGGAASVAVSERSLPGVSVRKEPDGRRLGDKFSTSDPGWVSSLFAMGIRRLRHRHPFNPNPAVPSPLASDARIVVVGDWGSGVPRARLVAQSMRESVEQALADKRQVHVIHLGDVYYSGWGYEYTRRFLRWWPVSEEQASRVGSWNLNGNHNRTAAAMPTSRRHSETLASRGNETPPAHQAASSRWRTSTGRFSGSTRLTRTTAWPMVKRSGPWSG